MPQKRDLTGKKFQRLTVIKELERHRTPGGQTKRVWLCRCDCGNEKSILGYELKRQVSCGCYRSEICSETGKLSRLDPGYSAINHLFWTYKSGAKRRNLPFLLTREDFRKIVKLNCFYCDTEPKMIIGGGNKRHTEYWQRVNQATYNGLDRQDNSKGYELENVKPCCKICNRAKSDLSLEEFYEWIQNLKKHQLP